MTCVDRTGRGYDRRVDIEDSLTRQSLIPVRADGVAAVIQQHFGEAPSAIRHCSFGHLTTTFKVTVGDRDVIVRTTDRPTAFAATVANLEALAHLGLPVPTLLARDLTTTRWPFAYIITDAFTGRDLRFELPGMSAAQQRTVARSVIDFQRRAASLPQGTSFGFGPVGAGGGATSWHEVVEREIARAVPVLDQNARSLLPRLRSAVNRLGEYFDVITPTCFLDDLTTKNVIVDRGVLQGVIDFDVVCYGDPLFQIALTQTAIAADLPTHDLVYVEELCNAAVLSARQRQVVNVYSGVFALNFLRQDATRAPESTAALMTIIART